MPTIDVPVLESWCPLFPNLLASAHMWNTLPESISVFGKMAPISKEVFNSYLDVTHQHYPRLIAATYAWFKKTKHTHTPTHPHTHLNQGNQKKKKKNTFIGSMLCTFQERINFIAYKKQKQLQVYSSIHGSFKSQNMDLVNIYIWR